MNTKILNYYEQASQNKLHRISCREFVGSIIVKPIYDFPGGRRFHFADPAGNELAVWLDK